MHDTNFSNYDEMGDYAITVDGDTAGDYWKGEIQSMADQLRKTGGLTEEADKHLQAWLDDHLAREYGWRAPAPKPPLKRAPKPEVPKNNAMMLALAAAAGVNAAKADEGTPTLGWGEWPSQQDPPIPTSPAERGFTPWSDYEPQPSYLDRVTSLDTYVPALPYFQGAQELAQTPVGQHIGKQIGNAAEDRDNVGSFFQGVGRGLYGVARKSIALGMRA